MEGHRNVGAWREMGEGCSQRESVESVKKAQSLMGGTKLLALEPAAVELPRLQGTLTFRYLKGGPDRRKEAPVLRVWSPLYPVQSQAGGQDVGQ